jgi:hypothetical protein
MAAVKIESGLLGSISLCAGDFIDASRRLFIAASFRALRLAAIARQRCGQFSFCQT